MIVNKIHSTKNSLLIIKKQVTSKYHKMHYIYSKTETIKQ